MTDASTIDRHERHSRRIQIAEAVLLALVTIVTAWAGYGAARWSTESRVELASAAALRSEANRALEESAELRNFDSDTFDAWFTAYLIGNEAGMEIASHRFRPDFKVAFDAWLATNPATSEDAPPGPTYMREYRQPDKVRAEVLDHQAAARFDAGERAASTSDQYVRITVLLAAVLFLVGIGTTFRLPSVRYGLIAVGLVLLTAALVAISTQPRPPA